ERDLPAAFLRRCTFFHIDDPAPDELARIVAQRFFSAERAGSPGTSEPKLPDFYRQLLDCFIAFRTQNEDSLQYRPGTSELIDWTAALRQEGVDGGDLRANIDALRRTASTVSKHKEDHLALRKYLDGLQPPQAR
ncbi:MAG TPA: hypothetical protein VMM27_06225, partial [Casimicrobiaceae bacterium]|nr:hypothetical protein [Casimicrobiaceae bacterium]